MRVKHEYARPHIQSTFLSAHMSQPQLGRIERGDQPYNQDLLEALADLYGCSVADLLIRDPSDPTAIWSIWDHAKPGERRLITAAAEAILKTGTDGPE